MSQTRKADPSERWAVCYYLRAAGGLRGASRVRHFATGAAAMDWMRANMATHFYLYLTDRWSLN